MTATQAARPLSPTLTAFRLAMRELLRRWPTLIFMVVMPAAYFLVSWLTADGTTTVPLVVEADGGTVVLTVLDRDIKSLYLAVLGISVTSAFAALTALRGTGEMMRRLRLVGYRPGQLLFARLGVLGLIVVVSTAIFLAIFLPLVDVSQALVVALAMLAVGAIGVGLGALLGLLFDREFEPAMLIVAVAGMQLALGRSGSTAERYLLFTPAVDALKSGGLAGSGGTGTDLARAALHATVLLLLAYAVWRRRTRVGRRGS